jgi:protein tyrosine kinase modulator
VRPRRRYSAGEIAAIVLRRRWLVLLPFAVGLAAIPFITPLVPELYRSETLILVVPQRVPDSYVKSTITETIESRLPSISEQILSRSRLERIISDLDLYKKERARQVMEDVVRRMRADITVTLAPKSLDSFRVSYVNTDPATARKVTERLAGLYIDQNLKDREIQAESTNQFLEAQLQDAKTRLLQQEKKLEAYRRAHAGQLPSQLQGNLQATQNAQLQLQALNETMNRARERRLLIERQIADARAYAAPPPATSSQDTPGLSPAQQLEVAKARLETLRIRYTPDNPDVIVLERAVADLEKRVAREQDPTKTDAPKALSPDQKKVLDLQAELDVIDHQLKAGQAEEARLKQVIAGFQGNINAVPTRESELVELTRDYTTLQAQYTSLLTKREESKIAANLERQQIGEQFRVLDPASLPERPFNRSQRLGAIGSGAIGGLVLGLLLTAFLEFRDTSFRREEEVAGLLHLPVLALITVIGSDEDRRAALRRTRLLDAFGVAVLLMATAVLAVWKLRS